MGLPVPSMRLILREHKREPFRGRVLTLGRMAVLATYEQVLGLFREEGVEPQGLHAGQAKGADIPRVRVGGDKKNTFASDLAFFKLLGVDSLEAMDVSDYEGAEHIQDLNKPVPAELAGQFDAIFDFGTTEHVFDTKQVLDNVASMLKPGARVLHLVPATNRIGHGYHMFSPGLFYDYYWANQFTDCRAYLVESNRGDPSFIEWKLYRYEYNADRAIATAFKSPNAVGTFFVGRKTEESTCGVVPIQNQFMDRFAAPKKRRPPSLGPLKRYAPTVLKEAYRRLWLRTRRNGGLKYLGRI